jgi:predicted transposase YbfD/YdcC
MKRIYRREDVTRARSENASENLATARKMALQIA